LVARRRLAAATVVAAIAPTTMTRAAAAATTLAPLLPLGCTYPAWKEPSTPQWYSLTAAAAAEEAAVN